MATADVAMNVDVDEEILQMSAEDIARRTRLIENEIRVLKVRGRTRPRDTWDDMDVLLKRSSTETARIVDKGWRNVDVQDDRARKER